MINPNRLKDVLASKGIINLSPAAHHSNAVTVNVMLDELSNASNYWHGWRGVLSNCNESFPPVDEMLLVACKAVVIARYCDPLKAYVLGSHLGAEQALPEHESEVPPTLCGLFLAGVGCSGLIGKADREEVFFNRLAAPLPVPLNANAVVADFHARMQGVLADYRATPNLSSRLPKASPLLHQLEAIAIEESARAMAMRG